MTKYNYTDNIPFSTNNPSNDQPKMQENTNSIDNLINEDHYSFNQNNGGFHKQSRYPNLLSIPGATISSSTTLYAKSAEGTSNLFSTNGVSGNEYQLTFQTTSQTDFAKFGYNNSLTISPPASVGVGGWTFLPGNGGNQSLMVPLAGNGAMIYQYGLISSITTTVTTVTFPIPYTAFSPNSTVYSIVATPTGTNPINGNSFTVTDITNTSFKYRTNNVAGGFFWFAIGV